MSVSHRTVPFALLTILCLFASICKSEDSSKASFDGMVNLFMICQLQSIPNPVYLFQGIVLRRGAKGTGMKSIELALSMCDIVDIYGFTVDPGYTEWLV